MLHFPSHSGLSGFKRERYGGKAWVCQMCTTKAMGDLKCGAVMVATCQWELRELGGEILELRVRESPRVKASETPGAERSTGTGSSI